MDEVRSHAEAESDALFSTEHLHAQQQLIASRIEHLGHPARVISFPRHPGGHPAIRRSVRLAPRWIAGAAAAGLFIGIYVGTFVDSNPVRPGSQTAQTAAVPTEPATTSPPAVEIVDPPTVAEVDASFDAAAAEQFLLELEFAAERPHTNELIALDELTPHVRPIRTGLR
jgi:hypothetical protein